MKFEELTKEQIAHAKNIYLNKELSWDERMTKLVAFFGKSERTVRKWCSTKLNFKEKPEVEPEQYQRAKERVLDKSKNRFIITWAQCNTPTHKKLLANIEAYAEHIDATIHVIAGRYKNPTSVFQDADNEFWDVQVEPYLDANRHNVHKYVSIMSDIKIQPTATNPMSGLEGVSGINSCVFGAPRIQMETVPVLEGSKPKMMVTTGAVTVNNYTDSKSGKKGEFHHMLGFAIVEIKDKETFFVRQVSADEKTGAFTDLYYHVDNAKVDRINSVAAIVLGDLHYGHHDQVVLDKTFELMDKIVPEHVVLHDVFDGDSISHHAMKDKFVQFGKEMAGTNSLQNEIDSMIVGLKSFEKFKNVVIVRSNHDDFIDRWLTNDDWKKQPTMKNSLCYMQFAAMLLKQHANQKVKGVIPEIINGVYPSFITLDRNTSYKVKNWELGQHGDLGTSGSRGSTQQFRRLNTKIIVGHYHKPERKDGALSVGTSTHLRVGYNKGASPWLQSHVIIHNDGRAQHINFIDNEFTTFI